MTPPTPQGPNPYANPYAGYYSAPYSYYPWYPPAQLPPTPAERPRRPQRARIANALIAAGVAVITLGAIALAALAPTPARSPAAGLSQVYSSRLASDDGQWNNSGGCFFSDGGLYAILQHAPTLCNFRPGTAPDLASTGFYLEAEVGPAAAVSGQQKPCIAIITGEDVITVAFDQQGGFGLVLPNSSDACATGSALIGSAGYPWHTNGITPNRIGVRYDASAASLTVYANGVLIAKSAIKLSSPIALGLGASADGEAVFTRFSLYA